MHANIYAGIRKYVTEGYYPALTSEMGLFVAAFQDELKETHG